MDRVDRAEPEPGREDAVGRGDARSVPLVSGSSPATTRSSVDLPVPLMPTTPMRSPEEMVSDTSCSNGRSGRLMHTADRSTTIMTPEG